MIIFIAMNSSVGFSDVYYTVQDWQNTSHGYITSPMSGYVVMNISEPFDDSYGSRKFTVMYGRPWSVDMALEDAEYRAQNAENNYHCEQYKTQAYERTLQKIKNIFP